MDTLFVSCAALGAFILVAQIVLGLFGLDGMHDSVSGAHMGDATIGEGLELLSVRSVAAGVGFFGLAGLAALSLGIPGFLAGLAGVAAGSAALVGTAFLMRQVQRLDSDGSIRLDRAVGIPATVYLTIPPDRSGPGKVQLSLQGRTVEIGAVTSEPESLTTGSSVVVVSVIDPDTVEVIPVSLINEVLNDDA